MWWVAGLTKNKTKPSSWGLAELGNIQIQCYLQSFHAEKLHFNLPYNNFYDFLKIIDVKSNFNNNQID